MNSGVAVGCRNAVVSSGQGEEYPSGVVALTALIECARSLLTAARRHTI